MNSLNLSAITPKGETLLASYVRKNERVCGGIVGVDANILSFDVQQVNGFYPSLTLYGDNNLTVQVKEEGLEIWQVGKAYEVIWHSTKVIIYNLEADGGYTQVDRNKIEVLVISCQ